MSYIIFKNALGELRFSGDGSLGLSIKEITGLGTPDKIYETREYLDSDGQITISSRFSPRTITLSFDLKGEDISAQTAEIYRIFSCSGTLYTYFENSKRRIGVNQIYIDSFTRRGNSYRLFTVQFICDNPYFSDKDSIYLPCYEVSKNIRFDEESNSWNLDIPTVWGANNNDKFFTNSGHTKVYPIFTIYSKGDASDTGGFELLRVNPKNPEEIIQRFALNYALSDNEQITLCFNPRSEKGRRYISSSLGTNLLNCRSEESNLSDFWFDSGDNRIILNNLSVGNTISAYISYDNQYIEGVF